MPRLEPDDYEKNYEALIRNEGTTSMETKRLRVLVIETFKKINNLKSSYMKNIFVSKAKVKVHPSGVVVRCHKTKSYDDKSLMVLGPKFWN